MGEYLAAALRADRDKQGWATVVLMEMRKQFVPSASH